MAKQTPDTPDYVWGIIPAGGLYELAIDLYGQDVEDTKKMEEHVEYLWSINRDILRTKDSFQVNQEVRKPYSA